MNGRCHRCLQEFEFSAGSPVSRRDECSKCRCDLRVCKNCKFFEPGAHWDCRESVQELVLEKDKSNACEFFFPQTSFKSGGVVDTQELLRKKAEALFKK